MSSEKETPKTEELSLDAEIRKWTTEYAESVEKKNDWGASSETEAGSEYLEKPTDESKKRCGYTDLELCSILEDNGYPVTTKNIRILREGIKNGDIELSEEDSINEGLKFSVMSNDDYAEYKRDVNQAKETAYLATVDKLAVELKYIIQKATKLNRKITSGKVDEGSKEYAALKKEYAGIRAEYNTELQNMYSKVEALNKKYRHLPSYTLISNREIQMRYSLPDFGDDEEPSYLHEHIEKYDHYDDIIREAMEEESSKSEEKEETDIEETPEEESVEPQEAEAEAAPTSTEIMIDPDASSVVINTGNISHEIHTDTNQSMIKVLQESKRIARTDSLITSYLAEDCGMPLEEAKALTSEERIQTVKNVCHSVIDSISGKIMSIDTSIADRSRGDIKNVQDLQSIQGAITQLEEIIDRNADNRKDLLLAASYLGDVTKCLMLLNQNAAVFKEAYRNKKTLMIMKYETLVLSIISSVAYLLAQVVDFKSQTLGVKKNIDLEEIAPLRTIREFNDSVASGEFAIVAKDVATLRESYKEITLEQMSTVMEAGGILDMVKSGIDSLSKAMDNGKVVESLYRAAGTIVLILSVRDAVYSLYNMKYKSSDMLNAIKNFANVNAGGSLKQLTGFISKFGVDAENASEMAESEVKYDNRKISADIGAMKANAFVAKKQETQPAVSAASSARLSPNQENIPGDDLFAFNF